MTLDHTTAWLRRVLNLRQPDRVGRPPERREVLVFALACAGVPRLGTLSNSGEARSAYDRVWEMIDRDGDRRLATHLLCPSGS
jgi:hypothetical protein